MSLYVSNPETAPIRVGVYPKRRASDALGLGLDSSPAAAASAPAKPSANEPRYADFLRAPQENSSVA